MSTRLAPLTLFEVALLGLAIAGIGRFSAMFPRLRFGLVWAPRRKYKPEAQAREAPQNTVSPWAPAPIAQLQSLRFGLG